LPSFLARQRPFPSGNCADAFSLDTARRSIREINRKRKPHHTGAAALKRQPQKESRISSVRLPFRVEEAP